MDFDGLHTAAPLAEQVLQAVLAGESPNRKATGVDRAQVDDQQTTQHDDHEKGTGPS